MCFTIFFDGEKNFSSQALTIKLSFCKILFKIFEKSLIFNEIRFKLCLVQSESKLFSVKTKLKKQYNLQQKNLH